ncbi:type II toxin-antitoxin system VapC family toxin [Thiolinea disciformis]|uniref:type II toxin-antitoxin system VapC family toxin n=1 Tax=Thiolinea disciformis TaxID=125614 RepID=UPI00036F391B|nr:type II toxin-antitoxin system VapC family toxin [Thiolinea disciformis]
MNKLLDTCILIDYSRNKPEALAFVDALPIAPALSTLTVTKILAGIRNKREQKLFENFFAYCEILPVTEKIAVQGGQLLNQYMRSHGTDLVDSILAATVIEHKLELVTCNLKHFPMFPHLKASY